MAQFEDQLPTQKAWLHELAQSEIHPDAERLFQLGKSFDPQQLVEESTINFLNELHQYFNDSAKTFNAYSEEGTRFSEIKVYAIAQTAADFMLFRNQIKLIFSHSAHGVIQVMFAQHVRGSMTVDGQGQGASANQTHLAAFENKSQELLAQLGAFRDVYWTFQGDKITAQQVAKFYFAEFAKITRANKRSKAGDQLLLDQIKALLQQKGLDL